MTLYKTYPRLYAIRRDMLNRCYNKNTRDYKYYGGKGIAVCDLWRYDFGSFVSWAKSNGYKRGLFIDRIKNELGYAPNNCRFITPKQSQQNRTVTILKEINAEEIRTLRLMGLRIKDIAMHYSISACHATNIVYYRFWI